MVSNRLLRPPQSTASALIVLEKVLTHGARDDYTPADGDTSFERQTAHFALLDMIKKLIGRALQVHLACEACFQALIASSPS